MGYCMDMRDQNFRIKAANKVRALEAIKSLAGQETIRDASGRHFSWVSTNEFLEAKELRKALRAWRWDVDTDDATGDIVGIMFEGEKLGDDETLFRAIAPFVEPESFIEMQGEDGCLWRWVFNGKTCEEKAATISWE